MPGRITDLQSPALAYRVLPGDYAIAVLGLDSVVDRPLDGSFHCQLYSGGELTVFGLYAQLADLREARIEPGWALLELDGCFDFGVVGVMAAWTAPLAAAGIPIMALSSFATDYLLLKHDRLSAAQTALAAAGFRLID